MPQSSSLITTLASRVPRSEHDAHRPLQASDDLDRIFTLQETRVVSKSLTLSYKRVLYLLDPCGFSKPVRPVTIELFHSALDGSTTDGSPKPDEDSVSQWAVVPCRMHLAMWPLLRFVMLFLRCIPAFFRSRNSQAIIELALRQQLATYTQKGPKPRITPADRAFRVFL